MDQPTLSFISEIARAAGQILREMRQKPLDIQHKSTVDLVTAADKAAEAYIIQAILDKFPHHAIIAEESGSHAGDPAHQWFIDPLDGTVNYAHGMSMFSVSIGYVQNNKLTLGVIYDPLMDELYSAELGKGAFLNGQSIHVSQTSQLIDCLLVTSFKHRYFDTSMNNFDNFQRISPLVQAVRRLGSAALNLAYVAAGRLDGFWDVSLSQWDVAAGILLVQEAGGRVTKLYGESDPLSEPASILAANPSIHPLILDILKDNRERWEPPAKH